MALSMALAAGYCMVQLAVLGWPTRTVRLTTLLLAIPVGLYVCGLVTAILQLAYNHSVAAITDTTLSTVIFRSGYTVDPVIEELVKAAPLIVFAWRLRSQWGLTDYVLLGAGFGAGFGLLEALLRFPQFANRAVAADGGWLLPTGGGIFVPGPSNWLGTVLPSPTNEFTDYMLSRPSPFLHLAWSAIAGLGVGILLRVRGPARLLGLLPIVAVCVDHAMNNYAFVNPRFNAVTHALQSNRELLTYYAVAAVVIAVVLDRIALQRGRQRYGDGLLLAAERVGTPGTATLAGYATLCPPWSALVAQRFLLLRRSVYYGPSQETPDEHVRAVRDAMDATRTKEDWRRGRQRPGVRPRPWRLVIWLVFALPGLLYLAVGTFPTLAGVQKFVVSEAVFPFVTAVTGLWMLWTAWTLVVGLRSVPATRRSRLLEPWARLGFGFGIGICAVTIGAYVLLAVTGGSRATDGLLASRHLNEAMLSSELICSSALVVLCGYVGRRGITPEVLQNFPQSQGAGGFLDAFGALAAAISAKSHLTSDAGEEGGGSGGDQEGQTERERRRQDLARDPANGYRVTEKTLHEADVVLDLEERGVLSRVIRCPDPECDFLDDDDTRLDVKGWVSDLPEGTRGTFDVPTVEAKIDIEIRTGSNVILDTGRLNPTDLQALREVVANHPEWAGKIIWYP